MIIPVELACQVKTEEVAAAQQLGTRGALTCHFVWRWEMPMPRSMKEGSQRFRKWRADVLDQLQPGKHALCTAVFLQRKVENKVTTRVLVTPCWARAEPQRCELSSPYGRNCSTPI